MLPKSTEDEAFDLWDEMRSYNSQRLHAELHSINEKRRFAAASALHVKGDKDTLAYVLPLCSESNAYLRGVAARVLGQLGTPQRPFLAESIPVLSRLAIDDTDAEVRGEAAAALGHLASPTTLSVLSQASKDEDADVRANAAFAFGCIKHQDSIQELLRLTYDTDATVRLWAVIGLKRVSEGSPATQARLIELLNDPSAEVREESGIES